MIDTTPLMLRVLAVLLEKGIFTIDEGRKIVYDSLPVTMSHEEKQALVENLVQPI